MHQVGLGNIELLYYDKDIVIIADVVFMCIMSKHYNNCTKTWSIGDAYLLCAQSRSTTLQYVAIFCNICHTPNENVCNINYCIPRYCKIEILQP